MISLRDLFLLDRDITFLNHGSFGATPTPVIDAWQAWQRRLERQPVQFFITDMPQLLADARQALADLIHAGRDDLAFVPNATTAVNIIAHSLNLEPGDELLTTEQEYGACDYAWQHYSQQQGFHIARQSLPFPPRSAEEMADLFWQGVTPKTRLIFMSHITSTTAVRFPVDLICQKARAAGILTLIDGAHTVGQIPLDMTAIGADFYTSNCHKWLCSPKGSAFLYARPEVQQLIDPLVVSWGWGENQEFTYGSQFLDYLQWSGTRDISAYLAVPAAIAFQAEHNWTAVRQQCHQLLQNTLAEITAITERPSIYQTDTDYVQMAVAPLPPIADLPAFKQRLYDKYRIEIPATQWQDWQFIRISVQGYNTATDLARMVEALQTELTLTVNC